MGQSEYIFCPKIFLSPGAWGIADEIFFLNENFLSPGVWGIGEKIFIKKKFQVQGTAWMWRNEFEKNLSTGT